MEDSGFSLLAPEMFYGWVYLILGCGSAPTVPWGHLKQPRSCPGQGPSPCPCIPSALGHLMGSLGAGACPSPGIIILKPLSSPCHQTQLLHSFKNCHNFFQLLKVQDYPFPLFFFCLFLLGVPISTCCFISFNSLNPAPLQCLFPIFSFPPPSLLPWCIYAAVELLLLPDEQIILELLISNSCAKRNHQGC